MKSNSIKNNFPGLWIYLPAIFLIVLVVYRGALDLDFVNWDDPFYVTKNPMIQSLDWSNLLKMALEFHSANWHPLTWFSHAVDYRLYGLTPWGHHLTNIILHGMNTGLVFLLFVTIIGGMNRDLSSSSSLWISAGVTALLFGLHPLRVESVAWISERKDLLCGFFFLATLLTYLSYAAAESPGTRRNRYLLTVFFFILALLSKPMAVTIPLVLILLDVYPLNRFKGQEKVSLLFLEKLPFFALSLISGIITILAQSAGDAVKTFHQYGLGERFLNAIRALWFYLEQTFWPSRQVPFYPFPENLTLTSGFILVPAFFVIGITFFCVWMWRKKQQFWLIAWLYYLITIFPVIGIFQVGLQGAADRYTYLPTLSIYFLIGIGILWLWEKNSNKLLRNPLKTGSLFCSLAIVTGMTLLTIQQIKVWKNGESFWKYIIGHYPDQISFTHVGLGDFYRGKGLLDKAEVEFKTALRINSEDAQANYNLGLVYYESKEIKKAEEEFKFALKINSKNYQAHNSLGLIYAGRGQLDEAEREFKNAFSDDPGYVQPFNNLGLIYLERGQLGDAEREFKKVLNVRPKYLEAYNNLGLVYQGMGLPEKAIENFNAALKIDPLFVEAYNNLGLTIFKEGQLQEAENVYKKAIETNPDFEAAHYNLAQLFQHAGKWDKAVEAFKVLLNINPNHILARHKLGVLFFDVNRLKAAEGELVSVLKQDPGRADSHFYLAVVYAEMGRLEKAELEFKAALEINSENAEYHNQLGILYGKKGVFDKAEAQFKAALAINPKLASARVNLEKIKTKDNQEKSGGDENGI